MRHTARHLVDAGIHSVLLGGAVVSICMQRPWVSGNLDIVTDGAACSKLEEVIKNIGFTFLRPTNINIPSPSRYHPNPVPLHGQEGFVDMDIAQYGANESSLSGGNDMPLPAVMHSPAEAD